VREKQRQATDLPAILSTDCREAI